MLTARSARLNMFVEKLVLLVRLNKVVPLEKSEHIMN